LRSYLDCYPCLVRHALEASRQITDDVRLQRRVLTRVLRELAEFPPETTPVRLAAQIHGHIRAVLGVDDPYAEQKRRCNAAAMKLVPMLKQKIRGSNDPIGAAVKAAIAGNIIDFGALGDSFDIESAAQDCLDMPLGINDLERMKADLARAKRIVYVGDNAGEIVFDRLLVEEIQRAFDAAITFVVRGSPILNDATMDDARAVGLTDLVEVVTSGGDAPGCELGRSPLLEPLFKGADLIISKGQGNYEALSTEPYPICFLLRIKCKVIAQDIGGPNGTGAVKRKNNGNSIG
jgi:uncharacterized protein with ATP-grasp and redox domains